MNKIYQRLQIEKDINDNFNKLLKSGKMKLNLSLEEASNRRNVQIDEEHDEDILQAKRDEYYKDKSYTCVRCKKVKSREEFFRLRENAEGISHHCKSCECKYKKSLIERG